MKVLVVYESVYGATQGIAERIASTLEQQGLQVKVRAARQADPPENYDAVIIGSAEYFFHWMKGATKFIRSYTAVLVKKPVWLFSSGPLGWEPNDAQGRDLRTLIEPKEIAEFRESIHPREHRVFFGAMHPGKLGFVHKMIYKVPDDNGKPMFPSGDFRDWNDIDTWTREIAQELNVERNIAC